MDVNQKNILELQGLTVHAASDGGDHPVLDNIRFDLRPGEVLGIVGPSGSGKTMTARAVLGLLPTGIRFAGGDVVFQGTSGSIQIPSSTEKELEIYRRENVAMIFQNPGLSLNPSMQIRKQFRVISKLSGNPAPGNQYANVLEEMGFREPSRILDAYPHQLSGGELQRVIIGMTIIKAPGLWIADEPTTALDPEIRLEIINLLKAAQERLGSGMIYISHDPATVRRIADRVATMQDGRIVQISPAEAFSVDMAEANAMASRMRVEKRTDHSSGGDRQKALIQVMDVQKTYGQPVFSGFGRKHRILALDHVSFDLAESEVLGLIGASGSGKSTLARILTGLERPDGGRILFRGEELTSLDRKGWQEMRTRIQVIHQNPVESLTPHFTVEQHLAEAISLSRRKADGYQKGPEDLMRDLGLSAELRTRYPFQLSGGECQRVAIARSLALQPEVVICDEITSALDKPMQSRLISLMLRMKKAHGFSLIWITHDLAIIRQVADRLILLERGQVLEERDTADFFRLPASQKGVQMLNAFMALS